MSKTLKEHWNKLAFGQEKQKIISEASGISYHTSTHPEPITGDMDVSELLMNLLDGMQRSEVSPYYWAEMLKIMQKIGPEKTLTAFEQAVNDLKNGVDPNEYA